MTSLWIRNIFKSRNSYNFWFHEFTNKWFSQCQIAIKLVINSLNHKSLQLTLWILRNINRIIEEIISGISFCLEGLDGPFYMCKFQSHVSVIIVVKFFSDHINTITDNIESGIIQFQFIMYNLAKRMDFICDTVNFFMVSLNFCVNL